MSDVSEDFAVGSCTFLNMTGDITIVWNERNREQVLAVIRKKMDEGYTFFTTKRFLFHKLTRNVRVTKKNLEEIDQLIITDAQFDKIVEDMNDSDVASLVQSDSARLVKRKGKSELDALSRAKNAEEVIDKDSIAVRPIAVGQRADSVICT